MPVSTIGCDYYSSRGESHALVGERTGETFRLGDTVKVRLVEAVPSAGRLRLEILQRGQEGPRCGSSTLAARAA